MFITKKKTVLFIICVLLLAALLVGCNNNGSTSYNKTKNTIFTEGDFVCMPNENGGISILELSEQGKQKEILVIPETIKGKEVVSLGGRVYGGSLTEKEENRYRVFSSEKLKKLYIPFYLKNQYALDDNERTIVSNIIDIPNAVVVGETAFAHAGYNCKGVVILPDNKDGYATWDQSKIFLSNVIFYEENGSTVLWYDYVDASTPANYVPTVADNDSGEQFVCWYAGDQKWNGVITPNLSVTAQFGYSDGIIWGKVDRYTGKIDIYGLLPDVTTPEKLTIPSSLGEKEVRYIGESAFKGETFSEVEIADTVEEIRNSAFADCSLLTKITFGENSKCENIYMNAFKNCTALTSFAAPDSLQNIYEAFIGCTALTTVDLANSFVGDASFKGCSALRSFSVSETSELVVDNGIALYEPMEGGKKLVAFANGCGEESYQIATDCVAIAEGAFLGNITLTSVSGGGLVAINQSAFEGCVALKTVNFNAKMVWTKAFFGCGALETVTLRGNGNVNLGEDCFLGTTSECKFYVPESKLELYQSGAEIMGIVGSIEAIE